MGKKEKPQPTQQYNTALAESKTLSPAQSKLQDIAVGDLNWLEKGDFRDPKGHIFFNAADPAMRKRQRELEMGSKGQGIYGLAGKSANPTALAAMKENLSAHNAEDDAASYEQNIREGRDKALGVAGDVASADQARKLAILGITSGPYQQQLNKPSWFDKILQGAGTAAQAGMMAAGSDSRLKDNIRPLDIEKLKQLQGVQFEWNLSAEALGYEVGKTEGGILADDVEKVFPEFVSVGSDGFKRVNYMALTGLLVEALKATA